MSKIENYAEELLGELYIDETEEHDGRLWYWGHAKVHGNTAIR